MVVVVASQHLRTIRGPLILPNIWEARWLFRSKWRKKKKKGEEEVGIWPVICREVWQSEIGLEFRGSS